MGQPKPDIYLKRVSRKLAASCTCHAECRMENAARKCNYSEDGLLKLKTEPKW